MSPLTAARLRAERHRQVGEHQDHAQNRELRRLIAGDALRAVYQPIIDLGSGAVVAYEALARGPVGSPLERPDVLFGAAHRADLVPQLDWTCRTRALEGARAAGLTDATPLFVNAEPASMEAPVPTRLLDRWAELSASQRVVLELTERELATNPAELLETVRRARDLGWYIAVDDLGVHPDSLALLPILRPDVIKLDRSLVQEEPSLTTASIVQAVSAEVERSGALVLAEGIETPRHRQRAVALGARLGQGWLFGHPDELPERIEVAGEPLQLAGHRPSPVAGSPFHAVSAGRGLQRAEKSLLIQLSMHLERFAMAQQHSTLVVATFQDARFFTPATRRRYAALADRAAFVAAYGVGMPSAPMLGVRGAALDPADPVAGEWDIAVLGPHVAAALVARDLGDTGGEAQRRFDYVLTHDREAVVLLAQMLMARIEPV